MLDVVSPAVWWAFIPTFFFVSITPGLCMTLAMTLGMSIGLKRTLWMMLGELFGVGVVACSAVLGMAAILLKYPAAFTLVKYAGGLYLAYIGINMWLSKGKMALQADESQRVMPTKPTLISQGFFTAVSNPKGWAFFVALLPPFIAQNQPLAPQLSVLVVTILVIEFLCMCLYAIGGGALRKFLQQSANVRLLNRISGSMMIGVAIWLAVG